MIQPVARFALPDDQREEFERVRREVERLEGALADAKSRRNSLVIAALQEHGKRRGAISTVARHAGITPEAARQLHRNPEAPWDRPR